jgi:hypothetical protein
MEYSWKEFLVEGDQLYTVLINNFENMFDGDIIKHFKIQHTSSLIENMFTEFKREHEKDIQKTLISWIRNELNKKKLFEKSNWKPFRNYSLIDMYYGYKKLFLYKQYYFQLGMETNCDLDECIYCGHTKDVYFEEHEENSQHFILDLYGWKDDNSDILLPHRNILIPIDSIMPKVHWIME